jgi:hypothetical protein
VPKTLFAVVLTGVLLLAVAAYADEARDYIENEVDDWTQIADNNGFEVLHTEIATIDGDNIAYYLDLAPGTYKIYASGGLHMTDLDMFAYAENGDELDVDQESDKIPMVEFSIEERQEIKLQVSAFSFEEGFDEEFFCFVVTSEEEGGQVFGVESEIIPTEDETIAEEETVDWDEDEMMSQAEGTLDYWEDDAADREMEVVESDIVAADEMGYTIDTRLQPGYYIIDAEPDDRCSDLDMTVYNDEQRELSSDRLMNDYAVCNLYVGERADISIELTVFSLEPGAVETNIAYVISRADDISDRDRHLYLEKKITDTDDMGTMYGMTMVDNGIEEISERHDVVSLDYDLDPGYYEVYGYGGVYLVDIDMKVYGPDDEVMDEDSLPDNYPVCFVQVDSPTTITIEVTAFEFASGKNGEYFAWAIMEGESVPDWEGYGDEEYTESEEYSGDEDQLIESAGNLGDEWIDIAEENGEFVIDTFTEPLYDVGEENGWKYEIDLERGTYYVYGQGDDICLLDLDMVIYDEDGRVVDSSDKSDNYPWCTIDVPRSGGTYTIVVYAFDIACEVGYFWLGITKE